MSHHGREGTEDREELEEYRRDSNKLGSAVELLTAIANGLNAPQARADEWLAKQGYECPSAAAHRKEANKRAIKAKIEQLQKELEQL